MSTMPDQHAASPAAKAATLTTKILAVGTFAPWTDMSQVQRILPTTFNG